MGGEEEEGFKSGEEDVEFGRETGEIQLPL